MVKLKKLDTGEKEGKIVKSTSMAKITNSGKLTPQRAIKSGTQEGIHPSIN